MKEKLLSLPLAQLREIARSKGIKNIAATRKSALVDKLVALMEEENQEANGTSEVQEQVDSVEKAIKESEENICIQYQIFYRI